MKVEILKQEGNILTIKVHEEIDLSEFEENEYNGRLFGYLDAWIKGSSTDEQRRHYWALINDIVKYTGNSKQYESLRMKAVYVLGTDYDKEPTTKRNGMKKEEVQEWLQMIIEFCIENGIPFHHPTGYIPADESRLNYKLTMNRMCAVCGQPQSEIAHFQGTVGMGRNRKTIDHTDSSFLALCRKHHSQQHNMGEESFLDLYKLTPIKLKREELEQLGVGQ